MAYNDRINVIRAAVKQVTKILADRDLNVTQRGTNAYVEHDGNGRIMRVNIPYIPDNASDDLLNAIQGFLDHEVSHLLHSDFDLLKRSAKEGFGQEHNIIEDTFIERMMERRFRGSEYNLDNVRRFFLEKFTQPKLQELLSANASPEAVFGVLIVPACRAWAGQQPMIEFMSDKWDMIKDFSKIIGDDLIKKIAEAQSTKDTFDIAKEMKKRLKEASLSSPPPPPPSLPQPPQSKDPSKNDDESEEPQSGEGDSEPAEPDEDDNSSQSGDSGDENEPSEEENNPKGEPEEGDEEGSDPEGEEEGSDPEGEEEGSDPEGEEEGSGEDDDESEEGGESGSGSGEDDDESEESGESGSGSGEDDGDESDESGQSGESKGVGSDDSDEDDPDEGDAESSPRTEDCEVDGDDVQPGTFDLEAYEKNADQDFDDGISMSISAAAQSAAEESDYNVFTTDDDSMEVYEPSGAADSRVAKMESDVDHMIGIVQKNMERLIVARSQSRWVSGMRKGKINNRALGKLAIGAKHRELMDDRIFKTKEEHTSKDIAVQLVIDCSASMFGKKISIACQTAYALASVLERMHISHEVVGFTTKPFSPGIARELNQSQAETGIKYSRKEALNLPIFKTFEERFSPVVKRRFADFPYSGVLWNNIDGEALEMFARRMMSRREHGKLMIVLSDGNPVGDGNKSQIKRHAKDVIKRIEASEIDIIAIGIMTDSVSQYYKNYVYLDDAQDLPGVVMRELKDVIMANIH